MSGHSAPSGGRKQPGFQPGRHHLCSALEQELQTDAHRGPKKRKGLTSTERGASHRDTPKSPLGSVCHPKHHDASFREKQMRKMRREPGGKYTNFQNKWMIRTKSPKRKQDEKMPWQPCKHTASERERGWGAGGTHMYRGQTCSPTQMRSAKTQTASDNWLRT